MRWLIFISMLTVISNAELENDRTARSLRLRNILSSPLRVEPLPYLDDVELYEFPAHNDVLLRITPKKIMNNTEVSVAEKVVVPNNPHRVITSYLLNNKHSVKTNKVQSILSLLKKGIYAKKKFLRNLFAPAPSPIVIIRDQVPYPVIKEIEKPQQTVGIKYTKSTKTTEVESGRVAVPIPTVVPTKKTVTVSEVVQPKYSYKQASKDGTVMTYQFEDNPNVIVTETEVMPALPTYIKSRFEKVVGGVRQPVVIAPGLAPVPGAFITDSIKFGPPIIAGDIANVITPLPPLTVPVIPPAYARLQNMGYFGGGSFYGPPILVEEDIPVLLRSHTKIIKTPGPKGDVNVKITKNDNSLDSKMYLGASRVNANYNTNRNSAVISSGGNSNNIPPPPSISNVNVNSVTSYKSPSEQYTSTSALSQAPLSNTHDNNVFSTVINNENGSSFVYRQVNNKNLQPLDITQKAYTGNINSETMNGKIDNISNRMSYSYNNAPPVSGNIQSSSINMQGTTVSGQDTSRLPSIGGLRSCTDGYLLVTKVIRCPEPVYSIATSPIVVSDSTPFVYKQMNADGSSISTIGNQNNVIVNVKDGTTHNRGDIPDVGA